MDQGAYPTLVIGGTSGTGATITGKLLQSPRPVRLIARSPDKAHALFNGRVEVFRGDLSKPGEEFKRAFQGAGDVVFTAADPSLITPERRMREVDYGGVVAAVMAAKAAPIAG